MAVGIVTLTSYGYPKGFSPLPRRYEMLGTSAVGPAGSTYQTNGLPIAWGTINTAIGGTDPQPRAAVPDSVRFQSTVGGVNTYEYDPVNVSMRIIVGGAELANGAAIPTSVTSDTIEYKADFQKV